jgi:hypothetical protein
LAENFPVATAITWAPPTRPASTSRGVSPIKTVVEASNGTPYFAVAFRRAAPTSSARIS